VIDEFMVSDYEHVSARSFDEVVTAFEAAVGSVEGDAFRKD
jgi:hypothetical protein